jgi:hypothetical protein
MMETENDTINSKTRYMHSRAVEAFTLANAISNRLFGECEPPIETNMMDVDVSIQGQIMDTMVVIERIINRLNYIKQGVR